MRIATEFEGARAQVAGIERGRATVTVPGDQGAPRFRQHFAFDVLGTPGDEVTIEIANAGECTWADAFGGPYRVFVSEGARWGRAATALADGRLTIRHRLGGPRARFAYYPPFATSRITRLKKIAAASGAQVVELGATPGKRAIERFIFGEGPAPKRHVWVIAQQHPGEAMAGWLVEGLVLSLARGTGIARELLQRAVVSVVPRMNPDGVAAGNHRTTPAGVDLNRAWNDDAAPIEVRAVREAMISSGADLLLDVHGDERLPWVFSQSSDHAGRSARIARQERRFERAMLATTHDYQTKHKYPQSPTSTPNLSFASSWAQHRFGCLGMILEMPFSDHLGRPDPRGFFPDRARALGRALVAGLLATVED